MIAFGLLLLAVAVALVFVAIWEGGDALGVEAFGLTADTTISGVFLAGVLTGLIALTGVVALSVGVRRKREHNREFEYLRQRVAEQDRAEDDAEAEGIRDWPGHGQLRGTAGEPAQGPFMPSPPAPRATPTYRSPQG